MEQFCVFLEPEQWGEFTQSDEADEKSAEKVRSDRWREERNEEAQDEEGRGVRVRDGTSRKPD